MNISTYIAGTSESARAIADSVREVGAGVEETASGWHRVSGQAEADWEGPASEAFRSVAKPTGRDADALAEIHQAIAHALNVFADELHTVNTRMGQAEQIARDGDLTVVPDIMIYPPKPPKSTSPGPHDTTLPGTEAAQAQAKAAQAHFAKQQAAFSEAQTTVNDARQTEKAAHNKLQAAIDHNVKALEGIGNTEKWAQAAEGATSKDAATLAEAAVARDERLTNAARAMFEKTLQDGPAAVHSAWASLSAVQQQNLIADYPKMVGGTNGVPVVARDQANRSILAAQKAALISKIENLHPAKMINKTNAQGPGAGQYFRREHELKQALQGLKELEKSLAADNKFLIDIDSTEDSRGQVVVATGNPDKADNVMTLVPGTFSDLGDAQDYVERNNKVLEGANELAPNETNATITWANYDSPINLAEAASPIPAMTAEDNLREFQKGLAVTHEGQTQAHNTVMGHSYGTTVVGYAADDPNFNADEVMFFGSPGVGVDHASQLSVGAEHVWFGTAGEDPIDTWTPSPNPFVWGLDLFTGGDHHWFGRDPSSPEFGGNILPTDPNGGHGGYWKYDKSAEAMARVMVGEAERYK